MRGLLAFDMGDFESAKPIHLPQKLLVAFWQVAGKAARLQLIVGNFLALFTGLCASHERPISEDLACRPPIGQLGFNPADHSSARLSALRQLMAVRAAGKKG
jgi:hypothetical protein